MTYATRHSRPDEHLGLCLFFLNCPAGAEVFNKATADAHARVVFGDVFALDPSGAS